MHRELKQISRKLKWFLSAILILVALMVIGFYKGYDYVENNPRFCQSCHIMEEPFQKWRTGPHHLVNCHNCHKQTKWDSLKQVWMYVTQRPDKVVHHPELDHKVCAQCHLSQDVQWKLIAETAGHKIHSEKLGIECLDCHQKGIHEIVRPVDVCKNCHADKIGGGRKMAFVHCLQCHNFLAKDRGLMPTASVCKNCHDKIQTEKPHPPLPAGAECIACHKPHAL